MSGLGDLMKLEADIELDFEQSGRRYRRIRRCLRLGLEAIMVRSGLSILWRLAEPPDYLSTPIYINLNEYIYHFI